MKMRKFRGKKKKEKPVVHFLRVTHCFAPFRLRSNSVPVSKLTQPTVTVLRMEVFYSFPILLDTFIYFYPESFFGKLLKPMTQEDACILGEL